MAKILHTADFHLDSAFTALPEEKARLRRQEARQLTDRLVDYANDHGVELLLLAGDLFDSDQLYGQTAQELAPRARSLIDAGDILLVKGSKGVKVSLIVDVLRKMGQAASPKEGTL